MSTNEFTDQNLLFGMLALQAGVLSEPDLVSAMKAWTFHKQTPLRLLLVRDGYLTEAAADTVEEMLNLHLQLHGNEIEASIQRLNGAGLVASLLVEVEDDDLQASIQHLQISAEDSRIKSTIIGESSSSGTRFEILRPFAQGGLGEVFVARDGELNREVAIKQIQTPNADDPGTRTRFRIEAEITGALEHPGIVPVYGLGCYDNGRPFYAMRLIRGESLKAAIQLFHDVVKPESERNLQFRELLNRFIDICHAVEYAHSRGVVHRDLKPSNVMLGRFGETLVVDWGLSRATGTSQHCDTSESLRPVEPQSGSDVGLTQQGSVIGTVQYMSPEQAMGDLQKIGTASDVYSMGAILYELLTGQPPIQWEYSDDGQRDIGKTLENVVSGKITRPDQVRHDVDRPLQAICLKALSKNAEQRYPSVKGLANEVGRWLADEPVDAWTEPLAVRSRRWIKRHQTLVTSVAASLFVALTVLSVMVAVVLSVNSELDRSYQRELAARERANAQKEIALDQSKLALSTLTAVVGDLHTSLKQLRGAGEVRKQILVTTLQKIEGLARSYIEDAEADVATYSALSKLAKEVLRFGPPERGASRIVNNSPGLQMTSSQSDSPVRVAEVLYEGAIRVAEKVATDHPNNVGMQMNLLSVYKDSAALKDTMKQSDQAASLRQKLLTKFEQLEAAGVTFKPMNALVEGVRATVARRSDRFQAALEHSKLSETFFRDISLQDTDDLSAANNYLNAMRVTGDAYQELSDYEAALEKYKECHSNAVELNERFGEDGSARRLLTISLERIATICRLQSRVDAAIDRYQELVVIRTESLKGDPDSTELQRDLAVTHHNLAQLYDADLRWREGRSHRQKSVSLMEKLAEADPRNITAKLELVHVLQALGANLSSSGEVRDAVDCLDRAYEVVNTLRQERGDLTYVKLLFCATANSIGSAVAALGNVPAATRYWQAALEEAIATARDGRLSEWARKPAAESLTGLGRLALQQSKLDEAEEHFGRALEIRKEIYAASPSSLDALGPLSFTLNNLANVSRVSGKTDQAVDYARQSFELIEEHSESMGSDRSVQRYRAMAAESLGKSLTAKGQYVEAARYAKTGSDINRKIWQDDPSNTMAKRDLALLISFQVELAMRMAEWDSSRTYLDEALLLNRELVAEKPMDVTFKKDLVSNLVRIANIDMLAGSYDDALKASREVETIIDQLREKGIVEADLRSIQSGARGTQAQVLIMKGSAKEALQLSLKALQDSQTWVAEASNSGIAKEALLSSHYITGSAYYELDQFESAIMHWQTVQSLAQEVLAAGDLRIKQMNLDQRLKQAMAWAMISQKWEDFLEHPQASELFLHRTNFFAERKDFAKVRQIADHLRSLEPQSATNLYNAARGFSHCSGDKTAEEGDRDSCQDQAIECLKMAVELGFVDVAMLREDESFEPIRNTDGFKAVVARMLDAKPAR